MTSSRTKTKKRTSSSKKSSSKTRSSRKKALVTAEGQACFWINNGPVVSNLKELRDALEKISDGQFTYHVHGGRNDFALWVKNTLHDNQCADLLSKSRSRKAAAKCVSLSLARYQ